MKRVCRPIGLTKRSAAAAVAMLLLTAACHRPSVSTPGKIVVRLAVDPAAAASPQWATKFTASAAASFNRFRQQTGLRLELGKPAKLAQSRYTMESLRAEVAASDAAITIALLTAGGPIPLSTATHFDNLAVVDAAEAGLEARLLAVLNELFRVQPGGASPLSAQGAALRQSFPFRGGLGQWDAGKQSLAAAILTSDGLTESPARVEIAMIHSRAGFPQLAIAGLRRLQEEGDAAAPGIRGRLGALLAATGQRKEAVEMLRQAIKENPRDASAHLNLGVLLVKEIGRHSEGVALFKEALRLEPANQAAQQNYLAAMNAGRTYLGARLQWERQLIRDPGDDDAKLQLAHALARLGELQRAAKLYRELIAKDADNRLVCQPRRGSLSVWRSVRV